MKSYLFVALALLSLLVACDRQDTAEPTPEPTSEPSARPIPTEAGYPPPLDQSAYPVPSPTVSGYPAPPTLPSPPEPYPAEETLRIVQAAGEQCAESLTYPDEESVLSALKEAGVTVLEIEQVNLMVCQACGCPTSEHYRVQIRAEDLSKAEALGWSQE